MFSRAQITCQGHHQHYSVHTMLQALFFDIVNIQESTLDRCFIEKNEIIVLSLMKFYFTVWYCFVNLGGRIFYFYIVSMVDWLAGQPCTHVLCCVKVVIESFFCFVNSSKFLLIFHFSSQKKYNSFSLIKFGLNDENYYEM